MTSSKIVIRPMTGTDLEAAIALDNRITGNSRRGFFEKRWAALGGSPDSFVWLVAGQGTQLVGFVSAHVLDGEFGGTAPTAVIDAIGVVPELRNQGVARALMTTLENQLKGRGIVELRTEADWVEHDLVRFFATAGFQLAPSLALESDIVTHL